MPDAGEVEDLIGTAEAARMLGVTAREVRRKAAEGVLPAEVVEGPGGREWRFTRTDVEAYRARRAEGAEDGGRKTPSVLPVRAIIAAEVVAEQLTELPEALRENTVAVRALAEELAAARAERDALAAERDQAREIIDELQAERGRSWWRRLIGR